MRLLLDTHLLLWAAMRQERLSAKARVWMEDEQNELVFSAASIWEVAIKHRLGRDEMPVAPGILRRGLLDNGYRELPVMSEHAIATGNLPLLHRDPFDRILLAQAISEGILLLTTDSAMADYGGPVVRV